MWYFRRKLELVPCILQLIAGFSLGDGVLICMRDDQCSMFFAFTFYYGIPFCVFRFPQTSISIMTSSIDRLLAKAWDPLSGLYPLSGYSPTDANQDILRPRRFLLVIITNIIITNSIVIMTIVVAIIIFIIIMIVVVVIITLFKDIVPEPPRSCQIYSFTCGSCNASYIGKSFRHMKVRVSGHHGTSSRTGKHLKATFSTTVRNHMLDCNHIVAWDGFKVLGRESNH